MSLINPGFGLIIWMTLAFGIVLFVLAKYDWKPITFPFTFSNYKSLNLRNSSPYFYL